MTPTVDEHATRFNLRSNRAALGLSQSKLARESGVPRFKINTTELGGAQLTHEQETLVRAALEREARRLAAAASSFHTESARGSAATMENGAYV
jgi:predicted transcriptional regulator